MSVSPDMNPMQRARSGTVSLQRKQRAIRYEDLRLGHVPRGATQTSWPTFPLLLVHWFLFHLPASVKIQIFLHLSFISHFYFWSLLWSLSIIQRHSLILILFLFISSPHIPLSNFFLQFPVSTSVCFILCPGLWLLLTVPCCLALNTPLKYLVMAGIHFVQQQRTQERPESRFLA